MGLKQIMQNEELRVYSYSRSNWMRELKGYRTTSFIFVLFTQKSDTSERASIGQAWSLIYPWVWEALRGSFGSHGGRTSIRIYHPIKVANNQGKLISPKSQVPGWNGEWKLYSLPSPKILYLCFHSLEWCVCVCVCVCVCGFEHPIIQQTFSEHLHCQARANYWGCSDEESNYIVGER